MPGCHDLIKYYTPDYTPKYPGCISKHGPCAGIGIPNFESAPRARTFCPFAAAWSTEPDMNRQFHHLQLE